jgi:bacillithiol biosynthesis cysteine-adding enzyme BshC
MPCRFYSTIQNAAYDMPMSGATPGILENLTLLNDWKDYLQSIEAPANVISQLDKPSIQFVLTGQQIGYLCSPVLTLYKIITAEVIADKLSQKSGLNVTPVFWLQTEDHDLLEISKALIIKENQEHLETNLLELKDNRHCVGDLSLENLISRTQLESLELPENLLNLILESSKEATLSELYGTLFYKLFPQSKIILFDPRVLNLSKHTSEIYKQCINQPELIHQILRSQSDQLVKNNEPAPIDVSKNRSLFFLSINGSRYRLDYKDNQFSSKETTYSKKDLEEILDTDPRRFSSSALLRPILQDSLFNSVFYIGGNSELQYHKQITALYKHFNLTQAKLLERAHGTIIDDKAFKWFPELENKTEVSLANLITIQAALKNHKELSNTIVTLKDSTSKKLEELLDLLRSEATTLDTTLQKPLEKTINSITESLSKFINKVEEQNFREDAILNERMQKVTNLSHPQGELQERIISAISIYTLLGDQAYKIVSESIYSVVNNNIIINNNS